MGVRNRPRTFAAPIPHVPPERTMWKEFKEFAVRGNVMDLAVGVIIGAAFTAIVTSLVNDVFSPFLGLVTGGLDVTNVFVTLKEGTAPGPYATLDAAKAAGAATVNVGLFLNAVLNFVLVAFVVFVRAVNRLRREEAAAPVPETPPAPTRDQVLLAEIRDALRGRAA